MFVGQHDYKLDTKGRLVIPSKFRDALEQDGGKQGLYVTKASKSLLDREPEEGPMTFLEMYTESAWKERAERIKSRAKQKKEAEWFQRKVAWDADFCSIDSQWRINLPDRLISTANLEKEVKVVGGFDHMEVWDRSTWMKVNQILENEAHHLEEGLYDGEE